MKTPSIGQIPLGIDGADVYSRVELEDEDQAAIDAQDKPAADWLEKRMLDQVGFACNGPGTLFCNWVTVLPFPQSEDRFVVIAHVRRDC